MAFNSREGGRGRHQVIHLGEVGVDLIGSALCPTATLVPSVPGRSLVPGPQGPHLLQECLRNGEKSPSRWVFVLLLDGAVAGLPSSGKDLSSFPSLSLPFLLSSSCLSSQVPLTVDLTAWNRHHHSLWLFLGFLD